MLCADAFRFLLLTAGARTPLHVESVTARLPPHRRAPVSSTTMRRPRTPLHMMRCTALLTALLSAHAAAQASDAPETVVVRNGSLTLHGLLWRPKVGAPFPAVLFNHGAGPNSDPSLPAILGPAFARHGYAFLFLYRRGAGLSADQGLDSGALMAQALAQGGQAARNELQLKLQEAELSDVVAAIAFLRAQPGVDANRVASVGHSFGGQLTLLLAERDANLRAAVVFGAAARSWGNSPDLRTRLLGAAGRARAPLFFIHAENDISVAPGKALAAERNRLGKPHRVMIYPPVGQTTFDGHGFVYVGLSTWERDVFAFLDQHMQP
jgi:carboxymethylenebutenolidase